MGKKKVDADNQVTIERHKAREPNAEARKFAGYDADGKLVIFGETEEAVKHYMDRLFTGGTVRAL